jgi:hemerythrin-like domain-containing protein
MDFSRRTAQLLHEDHRATIAMVEALESLISKSKKSPPDMNDMTVRKTLKQACSNISQEVTSHFAFEEGELFSRLAEFGDEAIGQHLSQEHQAMLPIANQVAGLAEEALQSQFSSRAWQQFCHLAGELAERMLTHIQKEEMALLPMLEELLDAETDMELATLFSQTA